MFWLEGSTSAFVAFRDECLMSCRAHLAVPTSLCPPRAISLHCVKQWPHANR